MTTTVPAIYTNGGYQQTEQGYWIASYSVYRRGQDEPVRSHWKSPIATESEARQWLAARILEDTK